MRKSLVTTGLLAATLASGVAYAQQSSPPSGSPNGGPPGLIIVTPAPQGGSAGSGPQLLPQGASPLIMGGPAAGRAMQEQMIAGEQQPQGGLPHPMMMGHHPREHEMGEEMMHMHSTKSAVFMFRDGDERVLIKCADDEPTKACVDGATALIDKLGGEASSGGSGSQQGQGNSTQ